MEVYVKIRIILCSIIIFCLFVGFGLHCKYLNEQIEDLTQEKASTISELQDIEANLETAYSEISIIKEELNQANKIIETQLKEIELQSKEIEKYKAEIANEEAKWRQRYEEYPVATEAWIAMKALGWNDIMCAGIMGNLMAETGGTGTLYLDWDSDGSSGYGLVQWIGERRGIIKSRYGAFPTVKEQIQYISDELYGENGLYSQVTESQLNAIVNAESPEESAYAFACYYERCSAEYRYMRRDFARKAYEYFTL